MSQAPPPPDVAVARKLLAGDNQVIAVVPVDAQVATWPLLQRLASAVVLLGRGRVALVRGPAPEAGRRSPEEDVPPGDAFRMLDLDPEGVVAELVLPPALGLAESAAHLARALGPARKLFAHTLIAFDGYVPAVREVMELPDAFVSAASTGRTRESDLVALVQLLPPARHLGTLLID